MGRETSDSGRNFSVDKARVAEAARRAFVLLGTIFAAEGFMNKGPADIAAGLMIVAIAALAPLESKFRK